MDDISDLNIIDFEVKEDTLSLYKVVKDVATDKIELEIGDSKDTATFQPQVKIMRWDNEVNLSVRYKDTDTTTPTIETVSDVIEWVKTDKEIHIYEKPEVAEDGGLEIEVVLKEKPISNVVEFSIETKGLDFFYQPELTKEEIEQGADRPENVVGSYAVYYKDSPANVVGGKEYRTGKLCHIFRPEVVDAKGNKVWGVLNVDTDSGLLTVTIDQKWLEKAVYPVIVDPTLGYTSCGASSTAITNPGDVRVGRYTCPSNYDTASKTTAWLKRVYEDESEFKGAIWLNSDHSTITNGLGSTSPSVSATSFTEYDSTFSSSPAMSPSTDYLLGVMGNGGGSTLNIAYDSGWTTNYGGSSMTGGFSTYIDLDTYFYSANSNRYSLYITYTEEASGTEADSERGLYTEGGYLFKEDFETGSSPWDFDSYTNSGGVSLALDSTSKLEGVDSIKVSSTASGNAYLTKSLSTTYTELYVQLRVFLPTGFSYGTGGYVNILGVRGSSDETIFWANIESGGNLTISGTSIGWRDTSIDLTTNTDYRIEFYIKVNSSTGSVKCWVNNGVSTSPNYSSGDINSGSTAMKKVCSGETWADSSHSDFYLDRYIAHSAFIDGSLYSNSERGLYTEGMSTSSSNRLLYTEGKVSSSSTKGLYTKGSVDGSSTRGVYTKASATSNSTRGVYSSGSLVSSSSRGLYTVGGGITSSERGIYSVGGGLSSSERGVHSMGSVTDGSTRLIRTEGYIPELYWVGGTGNWSDSTNHWATSSGGTPSAVNVPSRWTDVYFDENSFTTAGQSVTMNVDGYCKDIDWTGATNTPSFVVSDTNTLDLYGSLTFISNMIVTSTGSGGSIYSRGSSDYTIDLAGDRSDVLWIYMYNTGACTLQSNFMVNRVYQNYGSLNTQGFDIKGYLIILYGTVSLGSSTVTLFGDYAEFDMDGTFDCGTSSIIFDSTTTNAYFLGYNDTYYDVEFQATSGFVSIYGSNTFNNLTLSEGATVYVSYDQSSTITGSFTATGTAEDVISMQGSVGAFYSQTSRTALVSCIGTTSDYKAAQSIYVEDTEFFTKAEVSLFRYGTATDYAIKASLYSDSDGVPGSLVVACTTNLAASSVSAVTVYLRTFNFAETQLSADTTYWLVLEQVGGTLSDTNRIAVGFYGSDTDPYTGGEAYTYSSGSWVLLSSLLSFDYYDMTIRLSGLGDFGFVKSSGTVECDYLSLKKSSASGGAAWLAGINSTDGGGNTGWIFGSTSSSERGLYSIGGGTTSSEVGLYTQGSSNNSSERGVYTEGGNAAVEADSERLIHTIGKVAASSTRGLYTKGFLTSSSEKGLYTTGTVSTSSERYIYSIGDLTADSEKSIYTTGKQSSSSTRGIYTTTTAEDGYSWEVAADLETDDSGLSNSFSEQNYTDVATDDDTYVCAIGDSTYLKFLFKVFNSNLSNEIFGVTWKGKAAVAPSDSTVSLQVYNRNSSEWETLDIDATTASGVEFTLSGSVVTNPEYYYDENYITSCRVYQ